MSTTNHSWGDDAATAIGNETFSIGQVAEMLDMTISTLRYYDKEGLLDTVARTPGGVRVFSEDDIRRLNMIECLKATGMPIKDIRIFFQWCAQGDETIEKRYQMFLDRKAAIEQQIAELQNTLDVVNYKCDYYKTAMDAGTLNCAKLNELTILASNHSDYVRKVIGE